ncbi:hypothetical protein J2S90_003186 [Arthrobacter bambusae]|nr:hypothetical protein [Arthrobacter bambusae]
MATAPNDWNVNAAALDTLSGPLSVGWIASCKLMFEGKRA